MEQEPHRRPTQATDEELAAITREIHAQLRSLYAAERKPAPRRWAASPRAAADTARFLAAFVLPSTLTLGLVLLLRYLSEG